jgi:hypothetical protein
VEPPRCDDMCVLMIDFVMGILWDTLLILIYQVFKHPT